jgi:hypothetical protein
MRRARSEKTMAHPWHHAESSARKYGGKPEDYLEIHRWFDGSKSQFANFRHRALRHNAFGLFEAEALFGPVLINSAGRTVPTRFIGEQHVREDCGGIIPSLQDWLHLIPARPWMNVGRLQSDTVVRGADRQPDLSLEAWKAAVARGETTLGHGAWSERMEMMAEHEGPNPE